MPALIFTFNEIFEAHLAAMLALSGEIKELSDLARRPFDPGESDNARYHKIAKLGKQLADTTAQLHEIIEAHVKRAAEAHGAAPAAAAPKPEEAN